MIRNQMGTPNRSPNVAVQGSPCARPTAVRVTVHASALKGLSPSKHGRRDSSVIIVTSCGLGDLRLIPGKRKMLFS
jgi:hypothetical protein